MIDNISSLLPGNSWTDRIYGALRSGERGKLEAAALALSEHRAACPRSRATLSLLGYTSFQLQNYATSSECYEELVRLREERLLEVSSSGQRHGLCVVHAKDFPAHVAHPRTSH